MKLSTIRQEIKSELINLLQEGFIETNDINLLVQYINEEEYKDPTPQTGVIAKGAAVPKPKPTIQMDLINDVFGEFTGALDGLVKSFSELISVKDKLAAGFNIQNIGGNGYPFSKNIDLVYKDVIRWSAVQNEEIQRKIQKP